MKPKVFCVECGSDLDIRHDYGEAGSGWYVERCEVCLDQDEDFFALDHIQDQLDGVEWDADTLERIADIVRETGREVRDLSEEEDT